LPCKRRFPENGLQNQLVISDKRGVHLKYDRHQHAQIDQNENEIHQKDASEIGIGKGLMPLNLCSQKSNRKESQNDHAEDPDQMLPASAPVLLSEKHLDLVRFGSLVFLGHRANRLCDLPL